MNKKVLLPLLAGIAGGWVLARYVIKPESAGVSTGAPADPRPEVGQAETDPIKAVGAVRESLAPVANNVMGENIAGSYSNFQHKTYPTYENLI